jgi:hypothetical protein
MAVASEAEVVIRANAAATGVTPHARRRGRKIVGGRVDELVFVAVGVGSSKESPE